MITVLTTSVLTAFGRYDYRPAALAAARALVAGGVQSAIGHQATAEWLAELLGVPVPVNRIDYVQPPGEQALIFKLAQRLPEGVVLNREQLEARGYTLGVLERLA